MVLIFSCNQQNKIIEESNPNPKISYGKDSFEYQEIVFGFKVGMTFDEAFDNLALNKDNYGRFFIYDYSKKIIRPNQPTNTYQKKFLNSKIDFEKYKYKDKLGTGIIGSSYGGFNFKYEYTDESGETKDATIDLSFDKYSGDERLYFFRIEGFSCNATFFRPYILSTLGYPKTINRKYKTVNDNYDTLENRHIILTSYDAYDRANENLECYGCPSENMVIFKDKRRNEYYENIKKINEQNKINKINSNIKKTQSDFKIN
jgi:hypothetical protein